VAKPEKEEGKGAELPAACSIGATASHQSGQHAADPTGWESASIGAAIQRLRTPSADG